MAINYSGKTELIKKINNDYKKLLESYNIYTVEYSEIIHNGEHTHLKIEFYIDNILKLNSI